MKPSEWCQMMIDKALNGEDSYSYFQLKQMWLERGL